MFFYLALSKKEWSSCTQITAMHKIFQLVLSLHDGFIFFFFAFTGACLWSVNPIQMVVFTYDANMNKTHLHLPMRHARCYPN